MIDNRWYGTANANCGECHLEYVVTHRSHRPINSLVPIKVMMKQDNRQVARMVSATSCLWCLTRYGRPLESEERLIMPDKGKKRYLSNDQWQISSCLSSQTCQRLRTEANKFKIRPCLPPRILATKKSTLRGLFLYCFIRGWRWWKEQWLFTTPIPFSIRLKPSWLELPWPLPPGLFSWRKALLRNLLQAFARRTGLVYTRDRQYRSLYL